jgi:hypothetical protein
MHTSHHNYFLFKRSFDSCPLAQAHRDWDFDNSELDLNEVANRSI